MKPRVLVADDDDGVRTVVKRVLDKEGFEVVAVADGASALSASSEGSFDIAVIDIGMPGMDGFELVTQLRATAKYAQLPIVMLTGAGTDTDIQRGFELGVSDYIVKPFNREDLTARMWRLLRKT